MIGRLKIGSDSRSHVYIRDSSRDRRSQKSHSLFLSLSDRAWIDRGSANEGRREREEEIQFRLAVFLFLFFKYLLSIPITMKRGTGRGQEGERARAFAALLSARLSRASSHRVFLLIQSSSRIDRVLTNNDKVR